LLSITVSGVSGESEPGSQNFPGAGCISGVTSAGIQGIHQNELMALRQKKVRLGTADKIMELFTTHPNMLKR